MSDAAMAFESYGILINTYIYDYVALNILVYAKESSLISSYQFFKRTG